jgi:hypothetical protein
LSWHLAAIQTTAKLSAVPTSVKWIKGYGTRIPAQKSLIAAKERRLRKLDYAGSAMPGQFPETPLNAVNCRASQSLRPSGAQTFNESVFDMASPSSSGGQTDNGEEKPHAET